MRHLLKSGSPLGNYGWAVVAIFIVTMVGLSLTAYLDLTNIALFYLLPVLVTSVRWGRGPAFVSCLLGALSFNFFFVPPIYTLEVANVEHLFVLLIFLVVALVTGTIATRLKDETRKATEREQRTLALYELSREITATTDMEQALKTFADKVADIIGGTAIVLVRSEASHRLSEVGSMGDDGSLDEKEYAVARRVMEMGQPAGDGLSIFEGTRSLFFFPVKGENRTLAVLALRPASSDMSLSPEQRQLIETMTNLAGAAIVRLQLAKEAEQAKWLAESEKLHRTLLNSISHDFRTPLASITGAVTSLLEEPNVYSAETREMFLSTIRDEARRMNRFVENLLDMARLESGTLRLNVKWCDLQDITGVVLREARDILAGHPIHVEIPPDTPSVMADFILIEQVLINLLENAAKYSPPDAPISLSVAARQDEVITTITDGAPVISESERKQVFGKFYRQDSSKHISGTGLGLSICKGIVEAHRGRIWMEPSPEGGNSVSFSLAIAGELSEKESSEKE